MLDGGHHAVVRELPRAAALGREGEQRAPPVAVDGHRRGASTREVLVLEVDVLDDALVARQIEANSMTQAQAWVATSSYTPPLTSTAARDAWCAAHHADPAPLPYAFGTAS